MIEKVFYGDFRDDTLWTDRALENLIVCEQRWRLPGTDEIIACAKRELARRKQKEKEQHGKENV